MFHRTQQDLPDQAPERKASLALFLVGLAVCVSCAACAQTSQRIRDNEQRLSERDTIVATIEIHSETDETYVDINVDRGLVEVVETRPGEPKTFEQALPADKPFELQASASTAHLEQSEKAYDDQATLGCPGGSRSCSSRFVPETRYRKQVVARSKLYCETSSKLDLRGRKSVHLRIVVGEGGQCQVEEVEQ